LPVAGDVHDVYTLLAVSTGSLNQGAGPEGPAPTLCHTVAGSYKHIIAGRADIGSRMTLITHTRERL
jgi:hypothetical protein